MDISPIIISMKTICSYCLNIFVRAFCCQMGGKIEIGKGKDGFRRHIDITFSLAANSNRLPAAACIRCQ